MAFEFLSGLGDLISTGAGIYGMFDRRDPYSEIPTLQPMLGEISRARGYEQAALNPESPTARNLAAVFAEADRKNTIKNMMAQILLERRAQGRGDITAGVRGERRDESRYRAMLEAFQRVQDAAREKAVGSLLTAAQGARANVSAYAPLLNLFGQYADVNRAGKYGGIQAIGESVKTLPGILSALSGGGGAGGGQTAVLGMPWLAPPAAREVQGTPWRQPQIDFRTLY